jgi:hypothetical protein
MYFSSYGFDLLMALNSLLAHIQYEYGDTVVINKIKSASPGGIASYKFCVYFNGQMEKIEIKKKKYNIYKCSVDF